MLELAVSEFAFGLITAVVAIVAFLVGALLTAHNEQAYQRIGRLGGVWIFRSETEERETHAREGAGEQDRPRP